MRRSGITLTLLGLLCVGFFVVTDPRIMPRFWEKLGWRYTMVDAVYDATPGTLVGLAGAMVVACIGMWLMTRRAV